MTLITQLSPSLFFSFKISWHTPNNGELEFALRIFKELVESALTKLESLLEPGMLSSRDFSLDLTVSIGIARDAVWRSDFCR